MKVLVAGSRGYCGVGIVQALRSHGCQVVGVDLLPRQAPAGHPDEIELVGDIGNPAALLRAAAGCQAVINAVIYRAHLQPAGGAPALRLPGQAGDFDFTPIQTYQVNTAGTLNLLEAARQQGVKQAVLLSSARVVWDHFVLPDGSVVDPGFQMTDQTPLKFSDMYGLSKYLQEQIGRYYAAEYGMSVTLFRPWWVVDGRQNINRLGCPLEEDTIPLSPAGMVDRVDLGEACYQALIHPQDGCRVYYPLAGPGSERYFDTERLRRELDWRPVYDFSHLKRPL